MNVLLIGECFSENLGDPVICETVERVILERYPSTVVTKLDMSGKLDYAEHWTVRNDLFWVKMLRRLANRAPWLLEKSAFYRICKRDIDRHLGVVQHLNALLKDQHFDIAIFAGGALFMDYFSGVIYCIVKRLRKAHVKVVFHACGMGTLSEDGIAVLQKAFLCRNVEAVSLRDSFARFQKTFRFRGGLMQTYDTALDCNQHFKTEKHREATLGVNIMNAPDYFSNQCELIKALDSTDLQWKVFVNGNRSDEQVAKKVLTAVGIDEQELARYLCRRPEHAQELISTINGFDCIISYRMHAVIIAASSGIPNLGFVWDPKVREFYEKLGMPQCVFQPEETSRAVDVLKAGHFDTQSMKRAVTQAAKHSRENLYQQIEGIMGE